jgi:hypothetical protein
MPSTKQRCECSTDDGIECRDCGRTEFAGYCAAHWIELSRESRDELLSRYVPDPEPIIQPEVVEHVRTVYPAIPWRTRVLMGLWRVAMTAAVAWMMWRARR